MLSFTFHLSFVIHYDSCIICKERISIHNSCLLKIKYKDPIKPKQCLTILNFPFSLILIDQEWNYKYTRKKESKSSVSTLFHLNFSKFP